MENWIDGVFSTRFIPHGYCFMWRPELVWMHVISDLTIALAYFSIPITILVLLTKRKKSIPYVWVFGMFAAFIFFCGLTHLIEVVAVWHPIYYVEGIIKVFTAAVSLATAILIYPLIPILLDRFGALDSTIDESKPAQDIKEPLE